MKLLIVFLIFCTKLMACPVCDEIEYTICREMLISSGNIRELRVIDRPETDQRICFYMGQLEAFKVIRNIIDHRNSHPKAQAK